MIFSSIPTSQGFDEGDGDKCKAWIAKVEAADYVRLSTLATALGTTMSSEKIADFFTPARDDALTFIGSDGEIRGAQFEPAVQHYRSTAKSPLMSDLQLANAITATH
ncbi:hypothetical protein ALP72_101051 [Pseudomonas coronafaciens pv. coronafaciens]|uniref:DUF2388 domain-containing protein n=1 Tax=Pseudomonas coronafaciens TaxID=53409 RepID=UPI000F148070|nr:DUF2388 domain-containing protein [Pseudomonas coronafaciens]RMN22748.1 hypothetical protein ALQ62_200041 [Pseudomonas coronafaciens pv. zizaniae]RMS14487.1 hypothetical protein ALP72_101051 [Pseudomonas coronafaciens pv. coronafaciens]RMV73442.1 hypothetical protein ALP06_101020 [Pseudomonas coronafaciens pv. atropurpurea]